VIPLACHEFDGNHHGLRHTLGEKLTSIVVVGLQRFEVSEFKVGSFFFFFKSD